MVFLLSGRANTAQYMFWGHFFCKWQKCQTVNNHDVKFSHWKCIKVIISRVLDCQEQSVCAGLLLVPISWKSHINLNSCPSTVMWQGRKFSHCENIKNDSSTMNFSSLEEYMWQNMCFGVLFLLKMAKNC